MKNNKIFIVLIITLSTVFSCKTVDKYTKETVYKDSVNINFDNKITLSLVKGKNFNHPTYVIWTEDIEGKLLKTLFITQSYASGIFGHQMSGDTAWLNKSGKSYQPAALPYWTHKKGLINGKYLVPESEHPYVDAFSGATPLGNFTLETSLNNSDSVFYIFLEVNQTWDWNGHWTNNKFPESNAYKHSAQPSLIYSVAINPHDKVYYMNPTGHGDPEGKTGKLFTDLRTLTTAKNIFEYIKIEINN